MVITNDEKNLYINNIKISGCKNNKGKTVRGSSANGLWCDIILDNGISMRLYKKTLIENYIGNDFTTANNIYLSL